MSSSTPGAAAPAPDFARRFWDAAYARGEDRTHWHREPPDAALARLLAAGAPSERGPIVLDVGCGTGAEARWLTRRGHSVIALDLSLQALSRRPRGARDLPRRRWLPVAGSVLELPVADGAAGLVLDAGCLHSIGRASRARYARELARVTAPGSRVLIRGARFDCEEEGVLAVDAQECRRWFGAAFEVEWEMAFELAAAAGALDGVAVLLRKREA